MLVKIHKSYRQVVAICDSELLGKKFEEGKFQLDLTGEFFNGEELSQEKVSEIVRDMAREDATFNIVGENSVNLCKEMGVIAESGIMKIQGVPYALILL